MPKNKPTKEDLLKLAELGGDDKELFLLDKITAFKDEIEEIDQTLEETDEEIKELEKSLKESGTTLDSKIEQTRQELDSKVQELSAAIAKIDFTSSVKEIIQHISDTGILKGQDGKTPTKKELTAIIKPLIPKPEPAKEVVIDEEALAINILEKIDLSPIDAIDEKIENKIKDTVFETEDINGLEDFIKKNIPKREIGKRAIKFLNDFDGGSDFTDGYKITWNALKGKFDLQAGGGTEVNDLTASVTWANVPDANITESSVTQHEAALTITESQISDLDHSVDVVSNVATSTILGRTTAGSGDSEELTPTQVRTLINVEDGADVTDAVNVAAAGALMASNNLSDVGSVATAQQNLDLEPGVDVEVYDANNAKTDEVNTYTKQQGFGLATLTDAASISWDLDDAQVAKVTLTDNRTLANPTNMEAGFTYILYVIQDATGGRTLDYGANYRFPGGTKPVLSTDANAVDIITFVSDGTYMDAVISQAFAVPA